jgi:twitching motility protein PilT
MATLADLLRQALDRGADSLQLRVDQAPVLFVERRPSPLPGPPLTAAEVQALVDFLVEESDRPALSSRGLHDGRYETGAGRFDFRIRLLPEGTAIAFRPAPADAGTPEVAVGAGGWPTDGIAALLRAAWLRGASDVILSGGAPATVRLAGELVTVPGSTFSDEAILGGLGATFTQARRRELEVDGSADLAVEITDGDRTHRFRVNVFRQLRGIAAAFRPIWDRIPELATLHLPPDLLTLTDLPHGLVLVVGPTGAGKSTTLAVLLEHLNRTQARHIITLEDPIEHLFRPQRSLVHQREVGVHVESFSQGLRAALRECPDVILVGEMRDLDTIAAALTAAETGHLVFSTLHSGSATQAIDRIIDVFPQHQQGQVRIQLSDVLRGVVTQRLLPTVDGKGRVPVLEVVRLNYAFANLVRDRKTHLFASQLQTTLKDGNVPFDLSLSRAVKDGLVSLETAARAAHDPQYLRTLLGAMAPG